MLDDIRFTIPAVAKKAYVQELTHFCIRDGRITGYDGRMALSSPIGVDLDARPAAKGLLDAVRACEGAISLHVTPAGKLCVRAGGFRAYVPCLPDDGALRAGPEGEEVELGPAFYAGLRALSPVMGVDASRPWAMGVKVDGPSLYATNNVVAAQYWHGGSFPCDAVIPARAVEELLRFGSAPVRAQVATTPEGAARSVTFWFQGERWLWTALVEATGWPMDLLNRTLDASGGEQVPFPAGFFDVVAKLKPFLGEAGTLYLTPRSVSTARDEGEGASEEVDLGDAPELAAYGHRQLEVLGEIATAICWRAYPKPCMFTAAGQPLRGVVVGKVL